MKLNFSSTTVKQLFESYEDSEFSDRYEAELRPVAARIPLESYEVLEQFAVRWNQSKSALAAQLLESALDELHILDVLGKQEAKAAAK